MTKPRGDAERAQPTETSVLAAKLAELLIIEPEGGEGKYRLTRPANAALNVLVGKILNALLADRRSDPVEGSAKRGAEKGGS